MARLQIASPEDNRVYEITDQFVTIGRAAGNHLRLDDPAIGPVHLRLIHAQDGYRLELADTARQVTVNGEPCTSRVLRPDDRIEVGGTVLTFLDGAAVAPKPVPQPVRPARAAAPAPRAPAAQRPVRAAPAAGSRHAEARHH